MSESRNKWEKEGKVCEPESSNAENRTARNVSRETFRAVFSLYYGQVRHRFHSV